MTTHDKLRREASALFARRGYGGTSMSEIAERVGVRKASLYNYYASKADLLLDLLEKSLEQWEEACRASLAGETTVEERLAAYLGSAVRFGRSNPQAIGIIRLAAGQIPGDLRRRVQTLLANHDAEWREVLTRLFEEAIEKGEVTPADPYELSLFWSAFVDGVLINQVFATAKADTMVAKLQPLWVFFWRGVSGRMPATELQV
jgi:AcrR family transcriptional regulator